MRAVRVLLHRNTMPIVSARLMATAPKQQSPGQKSGSTIDQADIDHLARFSNSWWDQSSTAITLHRMNRLRVQLVVDGLENTGIRLNESPKPLKGIKLIDVGCGGGILSEPLARIGADVVGLDPSPELLKVAREHAAKDQSIVNKINYIQSTIDDFSVDNAGKFDAIIASEVIEHVQNPKLFLEHCVKVLKPGGSIFLTTFNKTYMSYLLGIIVAEYVVRIIPKGTHQWEKFVPPEDVKRWLHSYDCRTVLVHGMIYNPITKYWMWSNNKQVSYALHGVKKRALD